MKRILNLLIVTFVLISCSQTDKEKIEGEWLGDRIYRDGKLMCSLIPREQDEIAEREYQKQKDVLDRMNYTEYEFKEGIIRSMVEKLKMNFRFTPTDTLYIKTDDTPYQGEQWSYRIDEDSSILVLEENIRRVTYLYKVSKNRLILKNEDVRIEFVRKE